MTRAMTLSPTAEASRRLRATRGWFKARQPSACCPMCCPARCPVRCPRCCPPAASCGDAAAAAAEQHPTRPDATVRGRTRGRLRGNSQGNVDGHRGDKGPRLPQPLDTPTEDLVQARTSHGERAGAPSSQSPVHARNLLVEGAGPLPKRASGSVSCSLLRRPLTAYASAGHACSI